MNYLTLFETPGEPEIPGDLKVLVDRLASVTRFVHSEYPKGVFFDDVKQHTLRAVRLAELLKHPGLDKEQLIRTMWVHDIPELMISDVTTTEKHDNPAIEVELKRLEKEAAESLLRPADQELLEAYNRASIYLKGNDDDERELELTNLVAKLLDIVDGDITFHYYLSKWANTDQYDETSMPPERAVRFGVETRQISREQINKLKTVPKTIPVLLLNEIDQTILGLWTHVNSVPKIIKKYFTL